MNIVTDDFDIIGINDKISPDNILIETGSDYKLYQSFYNSIVFYIKFTDTPKFIRIILHNKLSKKSLIMLKILMKFHEL